MNTNKERSFFEIVPLHESPDEKLESGSYFKLKHNYSKFYLKFPILSLNKDQRVDYEMGDPCITNKQDIYKFIFVPHNELYELKFCIDVWKILKQYALTFKDKDIKEENIAELELEILGETLLQILKFCKNELEGYILKDAPMHTLVPYRQSVYIYIYI